MASWSLLLKSNYPVWHVFVTTCANVNHSARARLCLMDDVHMMSIVLLHTRPQTHTHTFKEEMAMRRFPGLQMSLNCSFALPGT